jgi:hypothetical protein
MKTAILLLLTLGILLTTYLEKTTPINEKTFTSIEKLPIELQQDERFIFCITNDVNFCGSKSEEWNCEIGNSFIFNNMRCKCEDDCPDDVLCDEDLGAVWSCRYNVYLQKNNENSKKIKNN